MTDSPTSLGAPQPLADVFQLRLDALKRRRRKRSTIADNRRVLECFSKWLSARQLDARTVHRVVVEEYFDEILDFYEVATARRHLTCLRAAYRYAQVLGEVSADPTATVVLPRQPEVEPDVYSGDELRALVAAVANEFEALQLRLLMFTGCRRSECLGIRYGDIDIACEEIRVLGKGDKLRMVPLHPIVARALDMTNRQDRYLLRAHESRRMGTATFNLRLRALLDRADVDGGRRPAHKFRRTVATSLNEEGVRELVIDQILGWAPSSIRGRYYTRISDRQKQDAIGRLYGGELFFSDT